MKASTWSVTPAMEAHWRATASSKSRSICAAAPPTSPSTASGGSTTLSNDTRGETPDEVDALGCDHAHARSVRVDQELGDLAVDKGGHHEEPRFACGLGRPLLAREHEVPAPRGSP